MKILKSTYLEDEDIQKAEAIKKAYLKKENVKLSFSAVVSLALRKFKL